MTEHSSVPWTMRHGQYLVDEDGNFVVAISGVAYPTEIQIELFEANIRFIITACNCHADLLEAAALALDAVCDMCKQKNPQHENCTTCRETESWREAIRKADEDGEYEQTY